MLAEYVPTTGSFEGLIDPNSDWIRIGIGSDLNTASTRQFFLVFVFIIYYNRSIYQDTYYSSGTHLNFHLPPIASIE